MKNTAIKFLLSAIILLNTSGITPVAFKVDTVVIDAGHGGKDPGTIGKSSKEKDIALKIALKTGAYIKKNIPGVRVLYTREDDTYVSWYKRADVANKNSADLFISIHLNALPGAVAYGTETYVMGTHKDQNNLEVAKRENSVILMDENAEEHYEGFDPNNAESNILFSMSQNAYKENSLRFAQKVEAQFKDHVHRSSRGVKQAGFLVLWLTAMPSVLIETGFLSNEKEETFLASEYGQDLLASAIFRAFREYKEELESLN